MTAPERYRFVDGEEIVLGDVPAGIRHAAITIAFGTGMGPWWEQVKTARVVLRDASKEAEALETGLSDRDRIMIRGALDISALDIERGGGSKRLANEYRALARKFADRD